MNVIGSRPDGWWLDRAAARSKLVAALATLRQREDGAVVAVVFDGAVDARTVEAGAEAGVEVSFAGRGADAADRVIAAEVASSAEPHQITVVTSDVALATAAREAGAHVMGASAFRRLIE